MPQHVVAAAKWFQLFRVARTRMDAAPLAIALRRTIWAPSPGHFSPAPRDWKTLRFPAKRKAAMTSIPPSKSGLDRLIQRGRQAHDTAEGCHSFAAADLARAGKMDTAQGRAKLEHSAATWAARGDMLQRLTASHEARLRAVAA